MLLDEYIWIFKSALTPRFCDDIIKYGNTMRTAQKPLIDWITDTQEELLDAVVYLEKVKEKMSQ